MAEPDISELSTSPYNSKKVPAKSPGIFDMLRRSQGNIIFPR